MNCTYCDKPTKRRYPHGLHDHYPDERLPYCDGKCRYLHWYAVIQPRTYEQIAAEEPQPIGQMLLL